MKTKLKLKADSEVRTKYVAGNLIATKLTDIVFKSKIISHDDKAELCRELI